VAAPPPSHAPASSGIPAPARAAATAPATQPSLDRSFTIFDRERDARLGVDGTMAGGLAFFFGASARYESASPTGTAFLLRAAYYKGGFVGDERQDFQALSFGAGLRAYSGSAYLGAEAALLALRRDPYEGPIEWSFAPNGTAMAGLKLGPLDASVHVMFPLVSIGLTVGADFVAL
jgi:hypothetical protein